MSKKEMLRELLEKMDEKEAGLLCYRSEGRQYGKGEKREGRSKRT